MPGDAPRSFRAGPTWAGPEAASAIKLSILGGQRAIHSTRTPDRDGLRIALYSHDTMGIGHLRRNLRIAESLAAVANPTGILLITGACEAGYFSMPSGVDCLTLPSLQKNAKGSYGSRSLGISLERLIQLRSALLTSALESFDPDILIVDKVPRGALGELDRALEILRNRGRARCILGLREILDDPETVRREWRQQQTQQTLHDYYDAIWIYGDQRVYDPIREYGLNLGTKLQVRYTGYLDPYGHRLDASELADGSPNQPVLPPGRFALCMVGGGQDGGDLAAAFCDADLPPDMFGVIVTGPFMPPDIRNRLRHWVAGQPRLHYLEFLAHPERLMQSADRIISMGGYNTVCEVLALGKPALIVPRVQPRREQLIRAERLRDLNLVDLLLPDKLSPAALSEWLSRELPSRPAAREQIDFGGLDRLPNLLTELMASGLYPAPASNTQEKNCLVTS